MSVPKNQYGNPGIFDELEYPVERGEYEDPTSFCRQCCEHTLGTRHSGIVTLNKVPMGVVSSSGFGDGGYDCFVRRDEDGKIVEVRIVFIANDADEEEEE